MQEVVGLEGIIGRLKTRLFGNPQQAQPKVKEEDLYAQISKMPPQYQEILVQVAVTPRFLENIDSQTKLILHHLHSIVVEEKEGRCFNPDHMGLNYLVDYGLAELRPYEGDSKYSLSWSGTKFVHPTKKGIQINDELEALSYDFTPPKGAFFDID